MKSYTSYFKQNASVVSKITPVIEKPVIIKMLKLQRLQRHFLLRHVGEWSITKHCTAKIYFIHWKAGIFHGMSLKLVIFKKKKKVGGLTDWHVLGLQNGEKRNHDKKITLSTGKSNERKFSFGHRVAQCWNSLPNVTSASSNKSIKYINKFPWIWQRDKTDKMECGGFRL